MTDPQRQTRKSTKETTKTKQKKNTPSQKPKTKHTQKPKIQQKRKTLGKKITRAVPLNAAESAFTAQHRAGTVKKTTRRWEPTFPPPAVPIGLSPSSAVITSRQLPFHGWRGNLKGERWGECSCHNIDQLF